jgi:hypothetical protein
MGNVILKHLIYGQFNVHVESNFDHHSPGPVAR